MTGVFPQQSQAGESVGGDLDEAREDLELMFAEVLLTVFGDEAVVLPAGPTTGVATEPDPDADAAAADAVSLLAVRDDAAGADLGVQVRVSAVLARLLAARMFGCDEPASEDLLDAVGELGNIVGGNVKSLLFVGPGHARLSLPSAVLGGPAGPPAAPGGAAASTIRALVLGELVELTLVPDVEAGALVWPPALRTDVMEGQL